MAQVSRLGTPDTILVMKLLERIKREKYDELHSLVMAVLVTQPIIYVFVAIFFARVDVRWFFLVTGLLLVNTTILLYKKRIEPIKMTAILMVVLASIGLSAASILTIEKIELLKNPQHVTSCSFSPVVACSPVIASKQATAMGHIPNPIFGIFGFACVLTAGMTILAGARKLSRAWWLTLMAGICFGVVFCLWLIHEGVYEIGALCLYCMTTWLVVFTMFWVVLGELVRSKVLNLHPKVNEIVIKYQSGLISGSIGIVILLLYFRWSNYWNSLL